MNKSLIQTSLTAPRTWGFRFSVADAAALAAFGALAAGLHRLDSGLAWVVAVAAVHFFLFCNVFRVARRRELIWAALFIMNVGLWLWLGRLDWFNVLACQLPVSVVVIAWEIRTTRYHGIFADRLNPTLTDYLEGRIQ
jgi:hypothetical protein